MRLDKFLKVSRLIKRRTVANAVCDQKRVFINNNPAKPSATVKVNDELTIEYANKSTTVVILEIPAGNVSIQQAKELYKIVKEVQYKESDTN